MRELEIQRENESGRGPLDHTPRVPIDLLDTISPARQTSGTGKSHAREQIERSEKLLIRAIHVMINLDSFNWDRWVPVVNVSDTLAMDEGMRLSGKSTDDDTIHTVKEDCALIHLGCTAQRIVASQGLVACPI